MPNALSSTDIRRNLSFALLLIGVAFAFPLALAGVNHEKAYYAFDTLNLYSLTAYLGYAHFIFAFEGQFKALKTNTNKVKLGITIIFIYGLNFVLFYYIGYTIFSFLAWIFFIPHFLKAEKIFAQTKSNQQLSITFTWLSFAIFTYALFGYSYHPKYHTVLVFILILTFLPFFIFKKVFRSQNTYFDNYVILGFFFLGEALVWASYNPYMTGYFRYGVYTFHIAAASFFHYFQSYGFAIQNSDTSKKLIRKFVTANIVITIILIGLTYTNLVNRFNPVLFFTVNVATHLASSEVFKIIKKASN